MANTKKEPSVYQLVVVLIAINVNSNDVTFNSMTSFPTSIMQLGKYYASRNLGFPTCFMLVAQFVAG